MEQGPQPSLEGAEVPFFWGYTYLINGNHSSLVQDPYSSTNVEQNQFLYLKSPSTRVILMARVLQFSQNWRYHNRASL